MPRRGRHHSDCPRIEKTSRSGRGLFSVRCGCVEAGAMEHILLFDGDCAACSEAARAVARMGVPGLEVRPLTDSRVLARLRQVGLEQSWRPALLEDDGAQVR